MTSKVSRVIAATLVALSGAGAASAKDRSPPPLDLHAEQELTIPVTIVDGKVVTGTPRLSKLGAAEPKDGEITVGLTSGDKDYRAILLVVEKTSVPIDFLATGLNGGTKIDEAVLCGRLDGPSSAHIGSIPWRVWLHGFEVGKGQPCQ
jgi:hypothetical protein